MTIYPDAPMGNPDTSTRESVELVDLDLFGGESIPTPGAPPAPVANPESKQLPIVIVSNDVVPGMGMAVAAPGLRSQGLAQGLTAAGFTVTQIVAEGPARDKWHGTVPPPRLPGVEIIQPGDLVDYIHTRSPVVVIAINSNQINKIPDGPDIHLIVDLFAPRMLEVACQSDNYPLGQLRDIRARNLEAFARADGFIVNGAKKVPFYLGWLMQVDRDPRTVPMDVVPMTMTKGFDDLDPDPTVSSNPNRQVQAVTAGYLQGWSQPGEWFSTVADLVGESDGSFNVLVVPRRGTYDGGGGMDEVFDHPAVQPHKEMLFKDFQRFMTEMDLAIDLYSNSIERQYAMVTRTVGAIACGLPVVHPPWSEVSPYIEQYDAGWLVDPDDRFTLATTLAEALNDREALARKAANARRLWTEVFNPGVAVGPLVQQINAIAQQREIGQL